MNNNKGNYIQEISSLAKVIIYAKSKLFKSALYNFRHTFATMLLE